MFSKLTAVAPLLFLVGLGAVVASPTGPAASQSDYGSGLRILEFTGKVLDQGDFGDLAGRSFHGRVVWETELPDMDPDPARGMFLNIRPTTTSTAPLVRGGDRLTAPDPGPMSDVHYDATESAPAVWWGPGDEPGDIIIIICEDKSPSDGGDRVSLVFAAVSDSNERAFVHLVLSDKSGKLVRGDRLSNKISRDVLSGAEISLVTRAGRVIAAGNLRSVGFRR